MQIHIFRDDNYSNFGDELSPWLLAPLLAGTRFRTAPGIIFGIGTLLWGELPPERPLIVFGSGAGYGPIPSLDDVDVRFVRGPRTAKIIGKRWITDPAILLADMIQKPKPEFDAAFMPHWTTALADPGMAERLSQIGITVIDPTQPVEHVLSLLSRSKLVLSEALHGAVVADALRIPWIPATLMRGHTFKWFDWCDSLHLTYSPVDLNVVSTRWAIDNWEPVLSRDDVHRSKLDEIKEELRRLRKDLS